MKRMVLLTTLLILLGSSSASHSLPLLTFGDTGRASFPQPPTDLIPDNAPSCGSLEVKDTRDGVTLVCMNDVYVVVVDLFNPNVQVQAVVPSQGGRLPLYSLANQDTIALINGDYTNRGCSSPTRCAQGLTYVYDGANRTDMTNYDKLCTDARKRRVLGLSQDWRPTIDWWYRLEDNPSICPDLGEARGGATEYKYNVVGGGPQFTFDGQFRWSWSTYPPDGCIINNEHFKCDPEYWFGPVNQTAVGYTSDQGTLLLAVSRGQVTMQNMHDVLWLVSSHFGKQLKNAIRYDGGSVSGLHYYNSSYSIRSSVGVADAWKVVRVSTPRPPAPSNLSASATGQTSIRLTWNDNSDNEDGFKIFRDGSQIATVGADTTSYNDNGLSCGITYSYYVKAYNSAGDSDPSNTDSATTDNCPPPPAPPLRGPPNGASLRSCENITLDWNDASAATEYLAQLDTDSIFSPPIADSGWRSNTDWNIGTRSPGTYYWRVQARNQWGTSPWSDTWSFTVNPNQAPNTPAPISPHDGAWVNSRTLTLQWQDNGDPDNCPRDYRTYNVEISRSGWRDSVSDYSTTSWQVTVPGDDDYQWRAQAYDGDLTSPWSVSRTVKVDATPPDTTIIRGPEGDIPTGDVSFSWAGSDNRTSTGSLAYSYRLRGLNDTWSDWAGSTTVSYSGLPDGEYTFEVKARDLAGNEDLTPASRNFFVDTMPPDTTITSGPGGCIGTADATFTWTGNDNRTPTDQLQYSFWLEGYDAGWSGWSSATSQSYTGLPDGPYTLHVKAMDGVGHEDPSPAGRSFQVDTTPPAGSVLINGGDSTTNQIAVRLDITGDDGPLGCGVTQMRLANDDHNYADWRSFKGQIGWHLPPVNRTTWAVHLQLKDLVGNVSGAFTDDIYLDFYPPRPASESYQLGARTTAGGDGRPTSESYQLDGTRLGQAVGSGRGRSHWYRLESGFQGAWPSVPRGRPPAEAYDVWDSVTAGSGDAPRSERYRVYGTGGQPIADGVRTSENYQLVSGFWLPAGWDVCGDDFDRDGVIEAGDIQRQIAYWRTSMGNRDPDRDSDTPNYEARFDRNLDGAINVADVMRLATRWGRRCMVRSP